MFLMNNINTNTPNIKKKKSEKSEPLTYKKYDHVGKMRTQFFFAFLWSIIIQINNQLTYIYFKKSHIS